MALAFTVILIFGGFAIGYTFYTVRNNEEETLNQLVAIINQDIGSRLETYKNACFDLVINHALLENLNLPKTEQYSAKQAVYSILRPVRLGDSSISDIMIIDFSGNVYSTDITLNIGSDFNLRDTFVYQQAVTGSGVLVWLPENDIFDSYGSTDELYQSRTNIYAAAIIKDYSINQELGVLILSLRRNFFKNFTYSAEIQRHTNLYLVSSDKSVQYLVSNTSEQVSDDLLNLLDFKKTEDFAMSQGYALDYQYNDTMGWYLLSVTDIKSLYSGTYQLILSMLIGIICCAILSALLSSVISRALYKGIADIELGMEKVENGNFDTVLHTDREDEIGHLVDSFNRMVSQIRNLILAKYEQELARREAEFYALQMQINPHFLYNTFDMLRWKLEEHEAGELSEGVVSISKVMRYSISNTDCSVTLAQEIENIHDYLQVMSSICSRRVDFEIHTTDEDRIMLPRLTLQPLVENSVLHGFESRERGNLLTINGFYLKPDVYCIDIIDNGQGVLPEIQKKINSNFRYKDTDRQSHIGVYNVRLRIQYLYGNESALTVESQYGYGTCVHIRLPLK